MPARQLPAKLDKYIKGRSAPWREEELFYVDPDIDEAFEMVVSVETDPIFRLGIPQKLFSVKQYLAGDIDPEGKRFLVIKRAETTEGASTQGSHSQINIIANWFEELKELVPVD
jgi:hypothetical protein